MHPPIPRAPIPRVLATWWATAGAVALAERADTATRALPRHSVMSRLLTEVHAPTTTGAHSRTPSHRFTVLQPPVFQAVPIHLLACGGHVHPRSATPLPLPIACPWQGNAPACQPPTWLRASAHRRVSHAPPPKLGNPSVSHAARDCAGQETASKCSRPGCPQPPGMAPGSYQDAVAWLHIASAPWVAVPRHHPGEAAHARAVRADSAPSGPLGTAQSQCCREQNGLASSPPPPPTRTCLWMAHHAPRAYGHR